MSKLWVAVLAFGLASVAWADGIYRWVDASGVVNYGTTPPQASAKGGSAARLVDVSSPMVSNGPKNLALSSPPDPAEALKRHLLEEQIETERLRQQALRDSAAKIAAARLQCEQSRQLDCNPDVDASYPVYYRGPRYILPRRAMHPQAPVAPLVGSYRVATTPKPTMRN